MLVFLLRNYLVSLHYSGSLVRSVGSDRVKSVYWESIRRRNRGLVGKGHTKSNMYVPRGTNLGDGAVYLEPLRGSPHRREGDGDDKPPYWESCKRCRSCQLYMAMSADGAFPVVEPALLELLEYRGILGDAFTWLEAELLPVLEYVLANFPVGSNFMLCGETIEEREMFYRTGAKVIAKWADFADRFHVTLDWVQWEKCSCGAHDLNENRPVSSCFSLLALGSVYDRVSSRVAGAKRKSSWFTCSNRGNMERKLQYPNWLPVCSGLKQPDFCHFSAKQRTLWGIALSCVSLAVLAMSAGKKRFAELLMVNVVNCGHHLVDADKERLDMLSSAVALFGEFGLR